MAKGKYKSRAVRANEQAEHISDIAQRLRDIVERTIQEEKPPAPFENVLIHEGNIEKDTEVLTEEEAVKEAQTVLESLDFSELDSLSEEMGSWRDNMQGTNLESTEKYQTVDATATTLENLDKDFNITSFEDIEQVSDSLDDVSSEIISCEFPGMYK